MSALCWVLWNIEVKKSDIKPTLRSLQSQINKSLKTKQRRNWKRKITEKKTFMIETEEIED